LSTSKPLTPSEVRELIVKGLRRSLVGPSADGDFGWLGEVAPLKDIDDPTFAPDKFPVGPWCDSSGREVIHQDPRFVYTVGVLHPISSETIQFEGTDIDDEDDDEPNPLPQPLVEEDGSKGTDDDELEPFVNFNKFASPRSIGFTIRPQDLTAPIQVRVTGAWYESRSIPGNTRIWWTRHEFSHEATLTPDGSSVAFTPIASSLALTVGLTTRVHGTQKMVTVWIRNDSVVEQNKPSASATVFQTELSAKVGKLSPLNTRSNNNPDSLDLLYSTEVLLATGHGCDVSVTSDEYPVTVVRTESMPVVEIKPLTPDIHDAAGASLAIGMDDLAGFNAQAVSGIEKLLTEYQTWLDERRRDLPTIPANMRGIADAHLSACDDFLEDMKEGWNLTQLNQDVRACLAFASRAMNQQRRAYNAPPRRLTTQDGGGYVVDGASPHAAAGDQAFWRPFQIAFVLASLPRFFERRNNFSTSPQRDWVNVIWMPTGGGKTEAYLGLAAFVILWERLNIQRGNTKVPASMKVLMRYTYRLLTVQQVSRAASLVCALELIRREQPAVFGSSEIRIGAWLGGSVTPNSRKEAVSQLQKLRRDGKKPGSRGFLLVRCPWCGTDVNDDAGKPVGYCVVPIGTEERVLAYCPDPTCEFHLRDVVGVRGAVIPRGIPFLEVDDDIYAQPPDFVVGTIDKTARIPWKTETQSLFGLNHRKTAADPKKRQADAPALFIQDELHLISGPLGTIDGVFEILLEEYCRQSGGRAPVYVAATATTKNFEGQAEALYRRPARLIPPPGLTIDNSFFARRDSTGPGKVYVGVCATGSVSGLDTQITALGSLAFHAAVLGAERMGATTDPWWSNVVFFSSRKALMLLSSAADTSLGQRIKRFRALSGRRSGRKVLGGPIDGHADRPLRKNRELTATSSDDINQVLDDLSIALPSDDVIDLCMATSMIEVGLDVSRLGLMTVIGQPKTASQYIQATGRVGRSADAVGLVVTVFKTTTPRDLAHYEGFTHWHRRMYASVESASVTPFTREALQRSLPSYMAGMLRMLHSGCAVAPSLVNWIPAIERLIAHIPPNNTDERSNVHSVAADLYQAAASPDATVYEWDQYCGNSEPLMYGADAEIPPRRIDTPYWRVMNSMRNVDADTLVNLKAFTDQNPDPQNPDHPPKPQGSPDDKPEDDF